MNWLDVIIIFVIFVSTSLSFFRGLLKRRALTGQLVFGYFYRQLVSSEHGVLVKGRD